MNGFITRTCGLACLAAGLAALAGCRLYDHYVDPCYPERYEWEARQPVYEAFGVQAANGHVLDQTVWSYQFEPGTDKLTQAGMLHLDYLARRRPQADPKIWLQAASDIPYDPAAVEKYVNVREELNQKRIQAVYRYLQAHTAGQPVAFEVMVHDPALPDLAGPPVALAIQRYYSNFQGLLPIQGTGPGLTAGGPTGPAPR
jgi:hypothetical protein